jgi:hypothetical protein
VALRATALSSGDRGTLNFVTFLLKREAVCLDFTSRSLVIDVIAKALGED